MDQYVAKTSGHPGSRGIHIDSFDKIVPSIKAWVDAGLIVTVNKFEPVHEAFIPK